MIKLFLRPASEVKIQPVYAKGFESRGLLYSITPQITDATGGQCAHCHTIVWVNSRRNKVLAEPYPPEAPVSGPEVKKYYDENIRKFLQSLPTCPECGHHDYNRRITSTDYGRFPDGTEVPDYGKGYKGATPVDPTTVKIWWYEDE